LGLLRKSKPDGIKPVAVVVGGLLLLGAVRAAAAPVPSPRLVRISTDGTSVQGAQHATIVEPDVVAAGSRVVATFQVGRYFGGSAGAIGFATSGDGARTWRSGLLPGITQATSPPGPSNAASDPTVTYDAVHRRWLIATLVNSNEESAIFVSGSGDGLTWDAPATAVSYPPETRGEGTAVDKEWITCDNSARSPSRGRCYLAYTDLAHDAPQQEGGNVAVQSTTDGGVTWSQPVLLPVDANNVSPGVQPVVRPNGELVIVFLEDGIVRAVRSNDGGATFAPRERIAALTYHRRPVTRTRLRGFPLPTATVDGAGGVYAAWPDCRFRTNCRADDIVWSRSTAPGRWTRPRRVPLGPLGAHEFTIPDLAVDPASRGARARLALTYYRLNNADCTETNCLLDVFLVTSRTAGGRWTRPRRINPQTMRLTWIAQTNSGRMVGDYTGTVFSGKRIVSVHVQARAPSGGRFNEPAYAYVLTLP
jgi:hypothetical protein